MVTRKSEERNDFEHFRTRLSFSDGRTRVQKKQEATSQGTVINAQKYGDLVLFKLIIELCRFNIGQSGEMLILRFYNEAIKVWSIVKSRLDMRYFK